MTRYRLQNVPTEKRKNTVVCLFLDQLLKQEEMFYKKAMLNYIVDFLRELRELPF